MKKLSIKIIFLIAAISVAGFFIYKGIAGPMKINTQESPNRLTSGLVGYWTFDGQDTNWGTNMTNDRSGQGNNGTMTSMSTTTSPAEGVIGQALDFDDINDYVDITNNYAFSRTNDFSVSVWINPKISSSNGNVIIGNFDGGTGWKLDFSQSTGKVGFNFTTTYSGGAQTYSISGSTNNSFTYNQWHHLILTFNGSTGDITASTDVKLYVNGVNETHNSSQVLNDNSEDWSNTGVRIGLQPNNNQPFSGKIDEVKIYNRALSANEITELYNQGAVRLIKTNTQDLNRLTNGLVGYWTFDGQDTNWGANTTNDRSGNGYNGTMTSMSTTTSPAEGVIGQAMNFDGSNDKVNLGAPTSLSLTGPFSISAWIYPKDLNNYQEFISSFGQYLLTVSGSSLRLYENNNEGSATSPVNSLSINQWQHVTAVVSGTKPLNPSTIQLYINGVSQTITASGTWNPSGTIVFVTLGERGNGYFFYKGFLDEVRVYNRALSASEVSELYKAGR